MIAISNKQATTMPDEQESTARTPAKAISAKEFMIQGLEICGIDRWRSYKEESNLGMK